MDDLARIVDMDFNRTLSEFPVYCQTKRDAVVMPFMHAHEGYEFHFSCSSVGICRVDDREYGFHPGKLTIIKPGTYHFIRTTQSSEYVRIILSIEESYTAAVADIAPFAVGMFEGWFGPDSGGLAQVQLATKEDAEAVRQLLQTIERELEQRKPHYSLLIKAKLVELFVILERQASEERGDKKEIPFEYRRLMDEIADHLTEHHHENLNMTELAAARHISKSYLYKLFKQHTGYTPHQFQILQRINRAKSLLSGTDESITEISFRVGFGETAHFSRSFKDFTGVTPGFYRSSMRD
ncbi:AraC family transcriptional regulator [Cohnella sp.]|uniref:AraC family transcriptional regulator n=1 Tax=Cohnella sp. TaxID=1883426 RepID=UPI003564195A